MSSEISNAFDMMRGDMTGKLSTYLTTLQSRYGDPRVYAQQMEERLADHAAVLYNQNAMTTKEALRAYDVNRASVRDAHKKRLRFET